MSTIRFEAVSRRYGDVAALEGFDLTVGEGELLALLFSLLGGLLSLLWFNRIP